MLFSSQGVLIKGESMTAKIRFMSQMSRQIIVRRINTSEEISLSILITTKNTCTTHRYGRCLAITLPRGKWTISGNEEVELNI